MTDFQYTARTPLAEYYKLWHDRKYGKGRSKYYSYFSGDTLQSDLFRLPMADVRPSDINVFLNQKIQAGISKGYVCRYKSFIGQIFDMAIQDGIVTENPCDGAGKIYREPTVPRMLGKESLDAVMAYLNYHPIGNLAAFIRYTGLLPHEARNLLWENVNLEKKKLYVAYEIADGLDELDSFEDPGVMAYKYSLQKVSRTIPLCSKAMEILQREKKLQHERLAYTKLFMTVPEEPVYVFTDNFGKPYSELDIGHINQKIKKETGIENFHIDSLRMHFNMELLQSGVSMKTMASIAGFQTFKSQYRC